MIMNLHEHIMMEYYDFEPTFESPPQLAAQETRPSAGQLRLARPVQLQLHRLSPPSAATAFLNSMISVSKPSSSVTTSWSPGLRFDSGVSWISSAAPLEGSMILPMNRGTSCSLS